MKTWPNPCNTGLVAAPRDLSGSRLVACIAGRRAGRLQSLAL